MPLELSGEVTGTEDATIVAVDELLEGFDSMMLIFLINLLSLYQCCNQKYSFKRNLLLSCLRAFSESPKTTY